MQCLFSCTLYSTALFICVVIALSPAANAHERHSFVIGSPGAGRGLCRRVAPEPPQRAVTAPPERQERDELDTFVTFPVTCNSYVLFVLIVFRLYFCNKQN